MRPLPLSELAEIVGGSGHDLGDLAIRGFALDSRDAQEGDLFLAIRGAHVDGHDFVRQALEKGAAATLAERVVEGPHVLVPDLVEALAAMALFFRERFKGPVVGITGSVGKTTTKEFVRRALSPLGRIAQTEGNRNTEYTAPLLWAELEGDESAVVVEMGMRGFGQIRHLASFSRPTIGLITNIGHSHLEMVGSREGIAQAKAELFESLPREGLAVAWAGDEYLDILEAQAPCPLETFGYRSGDAQVARYHPVSWTESEAMVRVDREEFDVRLPAAGKHLALNAAAALLVARACGVNLEGAAKSLADVRLPKMRMEVIERDGVTIVLDAYNASPSSFEAALETLAELPCKGDQLVVMGEMKELGNLTEKAHREVGEAIVRAGVKRACFFGEATLAARQAGLDAGRAEEDFVIGEDIEGVRRFVSSASPGDTVLIKGSRAMALERALESEGMKA